MLLERGERVVAGVRKGVVKVPLVSERSAKKSARQLFSEREHAPISEKCQRHDPHASFLKHTVRVELVIGPLTHSPGYDN